MNIKLRVHNLVHKCGTGDPFSIADTLGIRVMPLCLPMNIRGFFVRVMRRKYIVVNENLSEIAIAVVVCHELGHIRLHLGYGYYFDFSGTYYVRSKREREANEYAAHLLSHTYDVDSSLLARIINEKQPEPKLVHQILSEFATTGF